MEFLENTQISDDEYKQILLNMMDYIDAFCRENNIKYYLIGGTLLGAVRHRGFIPWDDDIDIGMLRDDYKKFAELFNQESKTYKLISLQTDSKYTQKTPKVIDTRTRLIENRYQSMEIGAYIDVFPLDYLGENLNEARALLTDKSISSKIKVLKTMNISKTRSFIKNMIVIIGHLLCWKSVRNIAIEYDLKVKNISIEHGNILANLYGAWGAREITSAENFVVTIELPFEGRKYYAPNGYHNYLTGVYGEYMKLPPVEKQVSHHSFKVYWK